MTIKERNWTSIVIDRAFQLKFLSYFVLLFLTTTASLYSTTFLFFWNMKKKALQVGIPEGHVYYQFLSDQKNDLDLLFLALAAFNFLILIVVGFIVSHRIAGPISKIKRFLQNPEAEENIQLRENDFFKDLAPIANQLKDRIK